MSAAPPTPSASTADASSPPKSSTPVWWYILGGLVVLVLIVVIVVLVSGGGGGTGTGTRTATSTRTGTSTSSAVSTGTGTGTGTGTSSNETVRTGSLRSLSGMYMVAGNVGSTPTVSECSTQTWRVTTTAPPGAVTGIARVFNVTKNLYLTASANGAFVTMTEAAGPTSNFIVNVGNALGELETSEHRFLTTMGGEGAAVLQTTSAGSATLWTIDAAATPTACLTPDYTIGTTSGHLVTAPTTAQGNTPFLELPAGGVGGAPTPQQLWKFVGPLAGSGTGTSAAGSFYLYNVATNRYMTAGDPAGGYVAVMSSKTPAVDDMSWQTWKLIDVAVESGLSRYESFHKKYLQTSPTGTVNAGGSSSSESSLFLTTRVGTS